MKKKLKKNSRTEIVSKLKNLIVTTLKLKLWQQQKQLNLWQKKIKNSNCYKTQLKLWQNSKIQIVTKPKSSNCDNSKTQILTKLNFKTLIVFGKNNLRPWQLMRCTRGSVFRSCDV